jgi:hypothetical protein
MGGVVMISPFIWRHNAHGYEMVGASPFSFAGAFRPLWQIAPTKGVELRRLP